MATRRSLTCEGHPPAHVELSLGAGVLLLFAATPLHAASPASALWTTPAILIASLLIAWGAEAAQFFVAQGFAFAMLAWLQVLPEFAVEAVLAWKQQSQYLLANLTGALRLLIGLGVPLIYLTAAVNHRRRQGDPLRRIAIEQRESVGVLALAPPLVYATVIWWKSSLAIYDAIVLIALYAVYLITLTKLPPEEHEHVEALETVPRAIVTAPRRWRIAAIFSCFLAGGALIFFSAEPFLGGVIAVAALIGIPSFVSIQWFAPIVSEFPELASTFYFARQTDRAPAALMNIVSSNINQWTLLVAMLPIVFSMGQGSFATVHFDPQQEEELFLTIAQSVALIALLSRMYLAWWNVLLLFLLFALQFSASALSSHSPALQHFTLVLNHWLITIYLAWAVIEVGVMLIRSRRIYALEGFAATWRAHIVPVER